MASSPFAQPAMSFLSCCHFIIFIFKLHPSLAAPCVFVYNKTPWNGSTETFATLAAGGKGKRISLGNFIKRKLKEKSCFLEPFDAGAIFDERTLAFQLYDAISRSNSFLLLSPPFSQRIVYVKKMEETELEGKFPSGDEAELRNV